MANVDRHIGGGEVRRFFEQLCGPVSRLRLLKEVQNSESRIAFVEFDSAEGALAALKCSGAVLGALALRISPSKTPVRESSGDEARRTKASAAASAAGAGPGSGGGPGGAAMSMPLAVVSLPLSVLP
jgi:RNA recognition motif-containing protein